MSIVDLWGPDKALAHAAEVYSVYDAVFGDQPDEQQWLDGLFLRHCARREFRLAVALDEGQLVGFAWGYVGERGQYWPDRVVATLPTDLTDVWVGGHFEFVELAVLDSHRRRGIGVRLHDRLLDGVQPRRGLLGTDNGKTSPAARLYRSRGWTKLGELTPDIQVMGLELLSVSAPARL